MSFISVQDFSDYIRVDPTSEGVQAVLDAGEAMMLSYLGVSDLAQRTVTEMPVLVRDRSTLVLKDGPLTSLTSLTVDGSVLPATDFDTSPWDLWVPQGVRAGSAVEIVFVRGWSQQSDVPAPIRQGIILTSAALWYNPRGEGTTMVGETMVMFNRMAGMAQDVIPAEIRRMVRDWRRPEL